MDERDPLPAFIRYGANFNVDPYFSRREDLVASLKDFCAASTKTLTQCLLHKYKIKASDTENLQAKLTTTQRVCNYTDKLLTNWTLNPNKKIRHSCSRTLSIVIASWIYNLCIIYNQVKESSFLSRYTLYRTN